MATENPEEPDVRQAVFGGYNASLQPYGVPLGVWPDARNVTTYAREGYCVTRNGYKPAANRIEVDPFAMLGGVEGGMVVVVPGEPSGDDPEGDFIMAVEDIDTDDMYYKDKEWFGYKPTGTLATVTGQLKFVTYGGVELGIEVDEYTWVYDVTWGSGDTTENVTETFVDQASWKPFSFNLPDAKYRTLVWSKTVGTGMTGTLYYKVYYCGTATITASGVDSGGTTRTASKTFSILYFPASSGGGGTTGDTGGDDTEPEDDPEEDTEDTPPTVTDDDTEDPTTGDGTDGGGGGGGGGGGAGPTPDDPENPPIVPTDDPEDPTTPDVGKNKYQLIVSAPTSVAHGARFTFTVEAKDTRTGAMAPVPEATTIRAYLPSDFMPTMSRSSAYYTEARYLLDRSFYTQTLSNGNLLLTCANGIFRLPDTPDDSYELITDVEAVVSASVPSDSRYMQGGAAVHVIRDLPTLTASLETLEADVLEGREYAGMTSESAYTATMAMLVTQTPQDIASGTYVPYDIVVSSCVARGAASTVTFVQCCPGTVWDDDAAVALTTIGSLKAIPLAVFQDGDGAAVVKVTVTWSGTAWDPSNGIWPWYTDDHWTGISLYATLPSYLAQNTVSLDDPNFDVTVKNSSGVGFARTRQILLGAQYAKLDIGSKYESIDALYYKNFICAAGQTWNIIASLFDPDHSVSDRLTGTFEDVAHTEYAMESGVINDTAHPSSAIPTDAWLESQDYDDEMATPRLGTRSFVVYGFAEGKCITTTYDLYRECDTDLIQTYDLYRICPET